MKCRAAVVLVALLTAVGAAAQSSSNGSFSVVDPGKFFSKPAQLSGQNASFTVDATDTDSNGDLTFFHFHADSTDSTQDSWLLVLSS